MSHARLETNSISNISYDQMKERMRQESTSSAEAVKSHSELLQQVKEMERVVEMERRQVHRKRAHRVTSTCEHQPTCPSVSGLLESAAAVGLPGLMR